MLSLQTKIENDHCPFSALKMIDSFLSIISVAEDCLWVYDNLHSNSGLWVLSDNKVKGTGLIPQLASCHLSQFLR